MISCLFRNPDEQIVMAWSKGHWYYPDNPSVSIIETGLFFKRVEHTRLWCKQNNANFAFDQTLFQNDDSPVHSRRVELFLPTAGKDSFTLVIHPRKPIEDIIFHSDYDTRLLDAMTDALLITETDMLDEPGPKIVYANKAYEQVSGYSRGEVIGKNPRILQGKDSSDEAKYNIRMALERWEKVTERILNYDRDGNAFWVELNISPVKDITGWYTHWISVQRNISKEREHLDSIVGHDLALNAVGFGTWSLDLINKRITWDARMCEIYGLPSEQRTITRSQWLTMVHPDDKRSATSSLCNAIRCNKDWDYVYRVVTPDGVCRHIRTKARIVLDELAKTPRMVGINWDITNEKLAYFEAEKQKEIAQRKAKLASLGEIVAGVGHEINNPLSIISVLADFIKVKTLGPGLNPRELIDTCDKIINATSRVTKIVKGLKSIARDKDDKLNVTHVNITEALTDTIQLFIEINKKKGINIHVDMHHADAVVIAEYSAIQQIVVNLLSNAVDAVATRPQPRIVLALDKHDAYWRFSVEDNGTGIPVNIREKLFEPFVTSKSVGSGTGLGLSISRSLAEKMDGQLTFQTADTGTVFYLDLVAIDKVSQQQVDADAQRPHRILIVEDDEMVRESMEQVLGSFHCEVTSACDGIEGISRIEHNPAFDVIITDMRMPGMDGYGFLNAIIDLEKTQDAKVYALTGDASSFSKEQQRQVSRLSDGWLEKPLRYQTIEHILEALDNKLSA